MQHESWREAVKNLSKGSPTDIISNFTDNNLAPEWRWALQSATSICKHKKIKHSTKGHVCFLCKSLRCCLRGVHSWKDSELINTAERRRTTTWGESQELWRQMWGDRAQWDALWDCFQSSETWLLVFTPALSFCLCTHTYIFLAASAATWLPSSLQPRF